LNPYDSSLQARIARANQKADDGQAAIAALTRAVSLRPQSRPLQHELGRALLSAGRYPEAMELYWKLLSRYPNDVDALVNAGLLAARLGHPEEALDDWHRAVDLDPGQANAQLYLGDALSARGEEQAAARHYRVYLQIVGEHPEQHGSESRSVLGALIKVADADARGHRPADAAMGYDAAAALAHKDRDPMMESLALVHHAEFSESEGNPQRAAQLFQRALALDASVTEVKDVAADWAGYGQFLRRNGAPERLAFACFLHAEELLSDTPGVELQTIAKLRATSEAVLGREAAVVRSHKEEVLKEAVNIPPAAFAQ
jgi:tetratricopeptide (TPR) repeat protein